MAKPRKAANGADHDEAPPAKQNTKSDDAAQLFLEAKEIKSSIARLNQKLGTTYARYENMGVDAEMVRVCLKLEKEDDAPEYVKRLTDMAQILRIVPVEVDANGQAAATAIIKPNAPPVSGPMAEKLDLHRAFWAGHDSGYAGMEKGDNPHEPGTALYVDWEKGWNDGFEDLGLKKPNVTKAPTEVRPRTGRAATKPPETALERDEAAYRGTEPQPEAASIN